MASDDKADTLALEQLDTTLSSRTLYDAVNAQASRDLPVASTDDSSVLSQETSSAKTTSATTSRHSDSTAVSSQDASTLHSDVLKEPAATPAAEPPKTMTIKSDFIGVSAVTSFLDFTAKQTTLNDVMTSSPNDLYQAAMTEQIDTERLDATLDAAGVTAEASRHSEGVNEQTTAVSSNIQLASTTVDTSTAVIFPSIMDTPQSATSTRTAPMAWHTTSSVDRDAQPSLESSITVTPIHHSNSTPSVTAKYTTTARDGGPRRNRNRDRGDNRKPNRRGRTRKVSTSTTDSVLGGGVSTPMVTSAKGIKYSSPTLHGDIIALDHPSLLPSNGYGNNKPVSTISTITTTALSNHISSKSNVNSDANGLATGAEIGIIIGSIALFWLILGPLLCVICRLKVRAKKRSTSIIQNDETMGAVDVEEMIRLELAKGREKMYQTSVRDVMEIERLSILETNADDYANLPCQGGSRTAIGASLVCDNDYANIHDIQPYDSYSMKTTLPVSTSLTQHCDVHVSPAAPLASTSFVRSPSGRHAPPFDDEHRDVLAQISTPMLSREPSQHTTFTGYRSNGSVSLDSGFDNRFSIKHDHSMASIRDRSPDLIGADMLMTSRATYKGYTPVLAESSSADKSLDSSPAFSGYANIRQLRRDHESAGSLTHDDDDDSESINSFQKAKLKPSSIDKGYHSAPKSAVKQILDPRKYLICNNHVGSLEKTGNPRNSRHFQDGCGECRCAYKQADDTCGCRASSMECMLDDTKNDGSSDTSAKHEESRIDNNTNKTKNTDV